MTNERVLREWTEFLKENIGCKFDEEGHTHCDRGEACPFQNKCVEDDFQEKWRRKMEEIEKKDLELRDNPNIIQEWKDAVSHAVEALDKAFFHAECRSILPTTQGLITRLAELVGLMYWEYSNHSLEDIARKYHIVGYKPNEVLSAAITVKLADDYLGWHLDRPADVERIAEDLTNVIRRIYAMVNE